MEDLKIFKIGGNVVDSPEALDAFLNDFIRVSGNKILVHGGGKEATRLSNAMGLETRMIDGRRVTDRQTLDIVTMVYAGLINKRVVAGLQARGCDAIGLTGADGDVIKAIRRPAEPIDYGFVGDLSASSVNARFVDSLLQMRMVPVFCAITHDGDGSLLNCNADTVASAIAVAMANRYKVSLTYCFELPGVLRDINDLGSVIPEITAENFDELKEEGVISAGMLPKVSNALNSVRAGVEEVMIKSAAEILNPSGTLIC